MTAPHLRFSFISGPAGWDGEGRDHKAKEEEGRKLDWQHLTYQVALQRNVGKKKRGERQECVKEGRYTDPRPLAQTP